MTEDILQDAPKFDPTKPYKEVVTKAPKFDPSKPYRPIVKEEVIKEGFTAGEVDGDSSDDELEKRLDFIQKDSKRTMRDDEKDILRDMYKNPNATKADLTDAILTLQGKKPKQPSENVTGVQYYMDKDERGIYKPIALGFGEKPPPGKQVNSIFGTQKSANDDAWYTDLAKTAYNILPSSAENVIDFFQAGTELATGEQSEYLQSLKNSANALKFSKDEDLQRSIYNAEGVQKWGDLISKDRLDLSPEAVWGTVNGALGSVGEFLVPASAISKGFKLGAKSTAFVASYLTNLGEGLDAADEAGIKGRDRSAFAMSVTLPLAAIDAKFGIGSKILSNKMANEAKQELIKGLGKKVVKDELGNITEQSLKEVSKEAVAAYSPLASSFVKVVAKDALEEGTEEALQSFVSSAGQQLYDKLTPEDKVKFGTDAFSVQSFGKYLSEGIAGVVGGGPLAMVSAKGKQKADYKAQSNAVYDAVKDGDEGVKALKTNITNAFEKGEINQQDYDNAMFKIDAYDSYNKVSSDLTLDETNKKKLFELSLQKENLTASIKAATAKDKEGKSRLDKMLPPELGLHNDKVKQAKALQDDIDLIVAKSEIIQQPEVSESVVDKVIKEEEKAAVGPKERVKGEPKSEIGELLGRYGQIKVKEAKSEEMVPNGQKYTPPKKVTDETRTMKDFTPQEFNEADFTIKQHKFADALDEIPEKTTVGTLQQDNLFKKENGEVVQTFNLTLDNGKSIRYASSKVRYPEENAVGGFRGNTYEENLTNRENPIGQKMGATVRTLKDSGRKVIFFWNADEGPKYGKHVGMAKETKEGKSVYSQADIDEMADLRMMNMGENPTGPAPSIINPEGPINKGPVKEKPTKKSPKKSNPASVTRDVRQELLGLKYTKSDIQNMTVKEAYDIANEKKNKGDKVESKDVEVSDKKKIAEYRKQEQEELRKAIPNIDNYSDTYGEEQGDMPNDLYAIYKPIYDKYNKLITEASENKPVKKDNSKGDLKEVQLKEKKDAKEVANRQKQAAREEKIKEIKEKKESILRSTRAIKTLINRYNDLLLKEKKSEQGLALLKNIKDKTNDIGYNLKLRDKSNLSLLDENNKLVYATPVKRSDDQKSYDAEKQRALRANPTSVQHAIILDVANGKQFDVNNLRKYFSDDMLKNEMPSLLKNSKGKGIKLEFYKTEIEEALGLKEDGGLDQEQVAEDAAAELEKYFVSGYREAAIQDAIEINFKTENGGLERDQIDALNRQAEEEEANIRDVEEGMVSPEIVEEELVKEEYRKLAEQEGYLQKVKPKAETVSKFKQSVDLFYKAKDTDGASKRRAILEERREFLEKNPSFKYIDDNMKYIYKELEQKGIIERFGECP